MKFGFKFANLCGAVYKGGNILFTADGKSVISPVGNRISVVDLVNHKCSTLPFESRKDITHFALSADSQLLVTVDEDGHGLLVNFQLGVVIHHMNFKDRVRHIKFSPNGQFFAASIGRKVQLWKTPSLEKEFAPLVLVRTYSGHHDDILWIDWSFTSKFFVTGSRDHTSRIYSANPLPGYEPTLLSGHRDEVVLAAFDSIAETIYTVGIDGALFVWKWKAGEQQSEDTPDYGRWSCASKHYFNQNHAKIVSASYHKLTSLLVVGFASGVFGLYELPEFNNIHTLSISQNKINTVTINASGEWLAFGCSRLGQLLVWEWQSETYILKQQGHQYDLNTVAYSPDSQYIATGGDDGKVKVWNSSSGFCFVTFADHAGPVTQVLFGQHGQIIVSASLDGTVRAFDLVRYRNFRTMTAPSSAQFSSLAIDPSAEIVCAGTQDSFEIYMWSLQTGRLLEVLSGHQGPVSCLAFWPNQPTLASGSWDQSVRLWDVYAGKTATETLRHTSDVTALAFRPDGKQLAVTTLDGTINFWDPFNATMTGTIEGRRDIMGGRLADSRQSAMNSSADKYFTSVTYTADGACVLAGGNSKFVCIYEVSQALLLKKFQISANQSLDGVLDFLNSKDMTEAGPLSLVDDHPSEDEEERRLAAIPGAKRGDLSQRTTRPAIRTKSVQFSPTGRSWAAASTTGLLIFSLDETLVFDPVDLAVGITPEATLNALARGEHGQALLMAFRLNETDLLARVFENIPPDTVERVARELPVTYLKRLLSFLVEHIANSSHLEFNLRWLKALFTAHGRYLRDNNTSFLPVLRGLQKSVSKVYDDMSRICNENKYSLRYMLTLMALPEEESGASAMIESAAAVADDAESMED